MTLMRVLVFLLVPILARADTSAAADPRLARCVSRFDAARRALGERGYYQLEEEKIEIVDGAVTIGFQDGWCMHHTSASATFKRDAGASHGWRRRAIDYGHVDRRRARGWLAEVRWFDHNESESGGGDLGDDFVALFRAAGDACLDGAP
jgi:hypothetical protein